jgi:membrane fusion protein (multidrug efflux system)
MGRNMSVGRQLGLPVAIIVGSLSLLAGCGKEPLTLARKRLMSRS